MHKRHTSRTARLTGALLLSAFTATAVAQAGTKPTWAELNPAQKSALAPLSSKWETMPADQKAKWAEMGNKFATMPPAEQARAQTRMRDWAALSPEERNQARESFQKSKSVPKDAKQAQWEQYQALPEEKKKELAEKAAADKAKQSSLPAAKPNKP
jgi:hypothetical protein